MNIINFSIFCGIIIFLLILHSYFKRGSSLTLNFFLFAFMLTFTRGGVYIFKFIHLSDVGYQVIIKAALSTLIWLIAFYLSWDISEKIVMREKAIRDKIFPTLLYAGMAIAAFSYAFETTATNIGWWDIPRAVFSNEFFLISPSAIIRWFYFYIYFLAPYFLITCSEYKKNSWNTIFFILPFLHLWIPRFFGRGPIVLLEEVIVFIILIALAFISPLRFDYSGIKLPARSGFLRSKFLESIPLLVSTILLLILAFLDLAKIQNPRLIISILPLLILILLGIPKVQLSYLMLFGLMFLPFLGLLGLPTIILLVSLCIFHLIGNISKVNFHIK